MVRNDLKEFRGVRGSRDLATTHLASSKAGESQDAAMEWANISAALDAQRLSQPVPGRRV